MSTFHETFDKTGVPPHIAYNLLKEALREESTRSIFAKQMHKTVSELADQGIECAYVLCAYVKDDDDLCA